MTESEQRRAALAGNRAIRELAKAFEIAGLVSMVATNVAIRAVNEARQKVETTLGKLRAAY
jgi:hypothetical protein